MDQKKRTLIRPRGLSFLSAALLIFKDSLKGYQNLYKQFGDCVHFTFSRDCLFFFHPDEVAYILKGNAICWRTTWLHWRRHGHDGRYFGPN